MGTLPITSVSNRWFPHSGPPPVYLAGESVWLASMGLRTTFILPLSPPLPDLSVGQRRGKGEVTHGR